MLDQEGRDRIERALDSYPDKIGYKLNAKNFVVQTQVSSISPLGWVHVYKTDIGKLECSLRYFIQNKILYNKCILAAKNVPATK